MKCHGMSSVCLQTPEHTWWIQQSERKLQSSTHVQRRLYTLYVNQALLFLWFCVRRQVDGFACKAVYLFPRVEAPSARTELRLLWKLCSFWPQNNRFRVCLVLLCTHLFDFLKRVQKQTQEVIKTGIIKISKRGWVVDRQVDLTLVKRLGLTFTHLMILWGRNKTTARVSPLFDHDSNDNYSLALLKLSPKEPQRRRAVALTH